MQKMPSYGVVVLFTDTSTKNHQLENEIIAYGKEKDIDVIVVFTPKYSGQVGDASWQVYQRVSKRRVFELKMFDFDQILGKVSQDFTTAILQLNFLLYPLKYHVLNIRSPKIQFFVTKYLEKIFAINNNF